MNIKLSRNERDLLRDIINEKNSIKTTAETHLKIINDMYREVGNREKAMWNGLKATHGLAEDQTYYTFGDQDGEVYIRDELTERPAPKTTPNEEGVADEKPS